jgi:hypothetical protein
MLSVIEVNVVAPKATRVTSEYITWAEVAESDKPSRLSLQV